MPLTITNIDSLVKDWTHWITLVGTTATLASLWIGYAMVRSRIEKFKTQARARIALADLATTKAAVEELLSTAIASNKALLHRRIMDLANLLSAVRGSIPSLDLTLANEFQNRRTITRMFEEQITRDVQMKTSDMDRSRFIHHLVRLKELIGDIEETVSPLQGKVDNDT